MMAMLHRQRINSVSRRLLGRFLSSSSNCRREKNHSNHHRGATTTVLPEEIINVLDHHGRLPSLDDRLELQKTFTLAEKGWRVAVEWKPSEYGGIGVFAKETIPKNTILRIGIKGRNLIPMNNAQDIIHFCNQQNDDDYEARLRYVADYLWGFFYSTDDRGYPINTMVKPNEEEVEERFFGFWIPGNGLNHNQTPNTVYRATDVGINLVALEHIDAGSELLDDYRRHGTAPPWLKQFAKDHHLHLNFADCNDFVM